MKLNNIATLKNKYTLLRHGQTIYQKEGRKENYEPDSPHKLELTEEGKQMVRDSAEKLKDKNIDIIFASPFLRTKQTAQITAEVIGYDKERIIYDDKIVDINLGEFMGQPMDESTKFYFDGTGSFDNRPKNGESWNDVLKRVKSFLDEVEKKYKDKNILIVSHADPIWLLAGYLRGIKDYKELLRANVDNNLHPKLAQIIYV